MNIRLPFRTSFLPQIPFLGRAIALATVAATALLVGPSANAATYDWTGSGGNTALFTAGNWSGGTAPGSADVGRFNAATYAQAPIASTGTMGQLLFGSGNTNGLTFSTNGSSITLNGVSGVGIQVDAGSGAVSTANAAYILGSSQSWINNSSSLLTVNTINTGTNNALTLSGSGATLINGAISGTGGLVISNGAVTLTANNSVNFAGGITLNSGTLLLNNNASLGIAGSSVLRINGGSLEMTSARTTTNAQIWNGAFALNGPNVWISNTGGVTLAGSSTVTVTSGSMNVGTSVITDGASSFGLTKAGSGTLVLASANTFDGGVTLNAGTLIFNNAAALGSGTFTINGGTIDSNNITITNAQVWNGDFTYGANVNTTNLGTGAVTLTNDVKLTTNLNGGRVLTVGGVISGTNSLTKDGAGQLTLTGSSTFSGGFTILNGTVVLNSAIATAGSGVITLGDSSGTNSVTFSNASSAGTSSPFVIAAGTTGTLSILTTSNPSPFYSGSVSLNNDLTVGHLGTNTKVTTFSGLVTQDATAHTITVSGGNTGAVAFTGGIAIGTGGLTMAVANGATSNVAGGGALKISGGITSTTTGNLTLQNNSALADAIIISGSNVNHTGAITNSGTGTGSVTISSAIGSNVTGVNQNSATSLLVLSGSNSYTGTTSVNSGTLQLGNTRALGATTAGLAINGGTLDLRGNSVTVGQLSGTSAAGVITTSTNTAVTLTSNSAGNSSYAGAMTNGTGTLAFTKTGTGTLTLSGSNSYTGSTTVTAGTLKLASADTLAGTSSVTVTTGGLLQISTSNAVRDAAAITLSGGTILRDGGVSEVMGNLTLGNNSFLDYGSGAVGSLVFGTYTQTPTFILNVANFSFGDTLVFATDLRGLFTNNQSAFFNFYGSTVDTDWSGSQFTITAVPEPSTVIAGVLMLGALLWPLRKKVLRPSRV